MKKETLKKLGLCKACEYLLDTDEYSNMESITEENDEFDEWQGDLDNPDIKKYKDKIVKFFESLA